MGKPIDTFINSALVSSGVGALGSIGSTFLNGLFNRDSMNRQVQASKELMDYEWNHFKSPGAQVGALAAAGINPAVAFGNNSGAVATPSPSMPQSVPPNFNFGSIGDFVKAMADAKKAGLESVGQELENEFNKQTLADRIKAAALANKLTEEETTKIIQDWNKTVAEVNVLQHDAAIKKIDAEKHSELIYWQLKQYSDKHNLDKQQFDALKEQLPVILDKLKNEKELLDVDVEMAKGYKGAMTQLGVVGQAIQILGNILKIFK